jgi:DNA-binding NarL/FixJ family response regulator
MGRPLIPLSVSAVDQAQLLVWSKRPKTAQALAMRSRVVLLAAEGKSNTAIATQLSVTLQTVGKWRQWYLDMG